MKKEEVYIDVYYTEDGYTIFKLCAYQLGENYKLTDEAADICADSGFFCSEDSLNEFLSEHNDAIEVVRDFRH